MAWPIGRPSSASAVMVTMQSEKGLARLIRLTRLGWIIFVGRAASEHFPGEVEVAHDDGDDEDEIDRKQPIEADLR